MKKKYEKVYDAYSKKILTNIQVVINIMKYCIPEYQNLSKEEILNCLDIDKNNPNSIAILPSDDIEIPNSKISYDVLFLARIPHSKEKMSMYINLEAQNDSNREYPLVTRAIYYASRLISRQKNKSFTKSKYGDIRKVYSIWICTSPKLNQRNTINYYTIKEECKRGNYQEKKENYSLINVVMFNLALKDNYKTNTKDINDMLEILLINSDVESSKKIKILNDNFDIMYTNKEASGMVTLSEGIEYIGMQKGFAKGLEQGTKQGLEQGIIKTIMNFVDSGISLEDALRIAKADASIKKKVKKILSDKTV